MSDPTRELAEALSSTAHLLHELWRCKTDEERREFGRSVAWTLEKYDKHWTHLIPQSRLTPERGST